MLENSKRIFILENSDPFINIIHIIVYCIKCRRHLSSTGLFGAIIISLDLFPLVLSTIEMAAIALVGSFLMIVMQ
jgi:hypothetical protein